MGKNRNANGSAARPQISIPMVTLGAGVRRPATPPAKSATPRVAAAPKAAAGESSEFTLRNHEGGGCLGATSIHSADVNWRNRGFLKLWARQTVSVVGTSVTQIALPTVAVFQLHAGPFELGLLSAFSRLPFPLLALPVGVWIDQLPRRRVMILADVGRTLALASIPIVATVS